MGLRLCLTLFLLSLTAVTSQHSLNCCLKTSKTKIPKHRVVNYAIQHAGLCPINAIVLFLRHGGVKCIHPDTVGIEEIIRTVDQKKMGKQNTDLKTSPKLKGIGKNRQGGKKKKPKKGRQ